MRGRFNDATGGEKKRDRKRERQWIHELIKLILPLSLYERRASKREEKAKEGNYCLRWRLEKMRSVWRSEREDDVFVLLIWNVKTTNLHDNETYMKIRKEGNEGKRWRKRDISCVKADLYYCIWESVGDKSHARSNVKCVRTRLAVSHAPKQE